MTNTNVFRGIAFKFWEGVNAEKEVDHMHDKVIIRKSIDFYHKCWKDRFGKFYDESY